MKLKVKKINSVLGLMFRKKPKVPVLIKLDGHGIHTWFVFYPIRAVFLDERCIISDICWHIKPFSTYKPHHKWFNFPSAFVIESRVDDPWLPTIGEKVELEVA